MQGMFVSSRHFPQLSAAFRHAPVMTPQASFFVMPALLCVSILAEIFTFPADISPFRFSAALLQPFCNLSLQACARLAGAGSGACRPHPSP
ncbi:MULTISPECIES: hypothetical protein [Cupriavidus]|uniref:hypothetical protein n=1 Tax=Cupriavidus sp. SK-3 TaxID=1470558 RepID=UPI001268205E|nr:hypothetical protein [Cupriavidus sp. SK-3]